MSVAPPSRPPSRVFRMKGPRRQEVSAVCFDSSLYTSELHSHLATKVTVISSSIQVQKGWTMEEYEDMENDAPDNPVGGDEHEASSQSVQNHASDRSRVGKEPVGERGGP